MRPSASSAFLDPLARDILAFVGCEDSKLETHGCRKSRKRDSWHDGMRLANIALPIPRGRSLPIKARHRPLQELLINLSKFTASFAHAPLCRAAMAAQKGVSSKRKAIHC